MGTDAALPRYKCHKEVWALKIKDITRVPSGNATVTHTLVPEDARYAPFEVSLEYIGKHAPQPGGYYVVYADGYHSYSPARAFEEGYSLLETPPVGDPWRRIEAALGFIERYGGIDGGHHKQWVLDQVVRSLVSDYPAWVKAQKMGEDGPATYDWDEGIAP